MSFQTFRASDGGTRLWGHRLATASARAAMTILGCHPWAGPPRASDTTKETAMPTSTPMQLGMVGLGRMGAGLVGRLMRDGHHCVVYDVNPAAVTALEKEGATGSNS